MSFLHNPAKRAVRRGWGIHAYVGANGGGKSAAMIWDSVPDLEAGRPILSTVRILDYDNPRDCDDERCMENPDRLAHFKKVPTPEGRAAEVRNAKALFFEGEDAVLEEVETITTGVHEAAHPLWIPWTRWDQLLRFNFGRVLADEMTGIASSRESQTLPSEVLNHLQQLRRADIPFSYTCPDWARADKSLREPTQAVTVCTGFLKKAMAPAEGELERVWKPRRLFKWQTYDARALDQLTDGKKADVGTEVSDWHWGPSSLAFRAYDTFAPVLQVGTATESGRCFRCGGTRPPRKCSCSDQHSPVKAPGEGAAKRAVPVPLPGARRLNVIAE